MYNNTCTVCSAEIVSVRPKYVCSPECKHAAKKAYDIARYPTIRDVTIARANKWQQDNRERKQEYDAQYREDTKVERLAAKRVWSKAFHAAHPEEGVYRQHLRRARKSGNGIFVVTTRDYSRMLLANNNSCVYCKARFSESVVLEWDHIIPIRRGGRHSVGNLAPSCNTCNRTKSVRFITEWRMNRVINYKKMPETVLMAS
jgi:5-methylcytosine-specific restriction endonuclease McrA